MIWCHPCYVANVTICTDLSAGAGAAERNCFCLARIAMVEWRGFFPLKNAGGKERGRRGES